MTSIKQTVQESDGGKNRFKKLNSIYKMTSIKQTMQESDGKKNRFEDLNSIYKMTSIKQTMQESDDDDVDDIINGRKNRFKELPSIYKMSSTEQTMIKSQDDKIIDHEISYCKKNRVKGLHTIYKMSSTKQTMKKPNHELDAGSNLLDCLVPDINVPIMKPSKGAWFKNWIQNARNAKCMKHQKQSKKDLWRLPTGF